MSKQLQHNPGIMSENILFDDLDAILRKRREKEAEEKQKEEQATAQVPVQEKVVQTNIPSEPVTEQPLTQENIETQPVEQVTTETNTLENTNTEVETIEQTKPTETIVENTVENIPEGNLSPKEEIKTITQQVVSEEIKTDNIVEESIVEQNPISTNIDPVSETVIPEINNTVPEINIEPIIEISGNTVTPTVETSEKVLQTEQISQSVQSEPIQQQEQVQIQPTPQLQVSEPEQPVIASPGIDINAMLGNLDSKTLGAVTNPIPQPSIPTPNEPNTQNQITETTTSLSIGDLDNKSGVWKKFAFWIVFVLGLVGGIFYIYTTRPMLIDDVKEMFQSLGSETQSGTTSTPLADKIEENKKTGDSLIEEDEKNEKEIVKEEVKEDTEKGETNIETGSVEEDIDSLSGEVVDGENIEDLEKEDAMNIDDEIDKELGIVDDTKENDPDQDQMDANRIVLDTLKTDTDALLAKVIEAKDKKLIKQTTALNSQIEKILTGLDEQTDIDVNVLNRSVSSLQVLFDKIEKDLEEE